MARTTAPKNKKRRQVARAKASPKTLEVKPSTAIAESPEGSRESVTPDAPSETPRGAAPAGFQVAQSLESRGVVTRSGSRKVKPYQTRRKPSAIGRAPTTISTALPREQEYAFIRTDLQQLLLIAGVLTVVMVLLLFIVDR